MNILSNALKYSPTDRPIELKVQQSKGVATLSCRNYGAVLSKEDCKHVFTPFYRSTTHETLPGTGLGLAITKEIIEQTDGVISVTSSKATGTNFKITLPTTV